MTAFCHFGNFFDLFVYFYVDPLRQPPHFWNLKFAIIHINPVHRKEGINGQNERKENAERKQG